jgi:predicted GIY-YIG superfamily endonuclease
MSKRMPLVSQHLEGISRDAIGKYQNIVRRYVRRRQDVYALYRRNKLYYIGLANNLRSRLAHHLRDHHKESWDRFSVYLTIGDSHLKELESLILRVVRPKGNKQKGKFLKSEKIRKRYSFTATR